MTFLGSQPALMTNRSMPRSVIIPVLGYTDVREAVDWLCRSFGFEEQLRIGDHRAQLSFGGGSVVVTELRGNPGAAPSETSALHPLRPVGFSHSIMVRVADIAEHYEQAKRCGAEIISPPTEYPYGENQYTVEDLGGHRWTFSQTIVDVDPRTWGGTLFEQR